MAFDALLEEYERRRAKALAMGGEDKIAKRRARGQLNARERIAALADPGSFIESGATDPVELMSEADAACYVAKANGRGRVAVYTPSP